MKAAKETFEQWREDTKFLCDQYSHSSSRVDFYTSQPDQPQLERWQGLKQNCLKALVLHYKRGQRWQIGEDDILLIFADYLTAPAYYHFLKFADFDSPESRIV
jgi:hypothetical protein